MSAELLLEVDYQGLWCAGKHVKRQVLTPDYMRANLINFQESMTFTVCHGSHGPNRNRWFSQLERKPPCILGIFHGELLVITRGYNKCKCHRNRWFSLIFPATSTSIYFGDFPCCPSLHKSKAPLRAPAIGPGFLTLLRSEQRILVASITKPGWWPHKRDNHKQWSNMIKA